MSDEFGSDYWDDRYGTADRVWSGQPNPQLVDRVSAMPPGTALDVGCGEGADAVWLARQGWQVTGLDVSQVALDKAAGHAADAGVDVTWRQADLDGWAGEPGTYDLVSAQFMYLSQPALSQLYRTLGDSVAPGGTLLLVGHHPMDPRHGNHDFQDVRWTPEEVEDWLDPSDWKSIELATIEREGHLGTMHDGIVQAVRAGA